MDLAGLNLSGVSIPSMAGQKTLGSNLPTRSAASFQVRCEGSSRSRAPDTVKVARREIALGLAAVCLIGGAEKAEARIVKPEIRRKIREKLEMLREKAGLSKKKDDEKKVPVPPPQPPSLSKKEKKFPLEPPHLPLPTPLEGSGRPLVEATVGIK